MAARLSKRQSDLTRTKIQAGVLISRLHSCAMGKLELTNEQIKSAVALLDRSVPKLSMIQHTGEDGGAIKTSLRVEFVKSK